MSYRVIFNFLSDAERKDLNDLIENLHWETGRQKTGYLKAQVPVNDSAIIQELIIKSIQELDSSDPQALTYDCYILKYPAGSLIPPHKDDAPFGSQHWRLNAIISDNDKVCGGSLNIEGRNVDLISGDAIIFRPDNLTHSVSEIKQGIRYVWSVGILK